MRLELASGSIHFEVFGRGPALLLSHGVIETADSWEAVVPLLKTHFQVVVYDARGRGRSGWDGTPFGYPELAQDVEDLAGHLGLQHFFHAGHSMGGRVALEHAIAHHGHASRLAVISARAEAPGVDGRGHLEGLIAKVHKTGSGAGVEMWSRRDDPHHDRVRAISAGSSVEGTAAALAALIEMGSLVPQLRQVEPPTLILAGDRDQRYLRSARVMAAAIPQARLRVLPGVGHFPNLECPELLARELTEFFLTPPTPGRSAPHQGWEG